jgi:hypothetical protein
MFYFFTRRLDEFFDHDMDDLIENQEFMIGQMVTHDELAATEAHIENEIKYHTTTECNRIRDEINSTVKN